MPFQTRSLALGLALGAGLTALLAMAPQDAPSSAPDDDQWAGRYRLVAVVPGDADAARIVRIDTQTGAVAHLVWTGGKDGHYAVRD